MTVYVAKGAERMGPYSIDKLCSAIQKREILTTDLVWVEGMSEWRPIHRVPDIMSAIVPILPSTNDKSTASQSSSAAAFNVSVSQQNSPLAKTPAKQGAIKRWWQTLPRPEVKEILNIVKALIGICLFIACIHFFGFFGGSPDQQQLRMTLFRIIILFFRHHE